MIWFAIGLWVIGSLLLLVSYATYLSGKREMWPQPRHNAYLGAAALLLIAGWSIVAGAWMLL